MSVPTPETIAVLDAIRCEINCGKLMKPERLMTPEERAWCNAHDRALQIIQNYTDGVGLFQIVGRVDEDAARETSKRAQIKRSDLTEGI